jgi:hypothetical protein
VALLFGQGAGIATDLYAPLAAALQAGKMLNSQAVVVILPHITCLSRLPSTIILYRTVLHYQSHAVSSFVITSCALPFVVCVAAVS